MALDAEYAAILAKGTPVAVDFAGVDRFELARTMRQAPFAGVEADKPVATQDIVIPGPAGGIPARIYRPAVAGPLPVVMNFHGGGWVIGTIAMDDYRCDRLAKAVGCVVVSVDYRMAPEDPFPAPLDDCYAATAWIADNAESLRLDRERLAVAGASAGANLAAAVAMMARDRRGPAIRHQLLYYPALDIDFERPSYRENGEGYGLTTRAMHWFYDQYLPRPEQRADPYALPLLSRDLGGLPPALIITAEYDVLRDDGKAYAEALRAAGNAVTYTCYAGLPHGFMTMKPDGNASIRAMDEGAAAIAGAFA